MRYLGLRLPFPTRSAIVRLGNGSLWIHSPVALTEGLRRELDALGSVAFLVSPNRLHTTWIGQWRSAWPAARVAAIGSDRLSDASIHLADRNLPWSAEIDHVLIRGDFFDEAVFFHKASRTLIVTDLIQNFELRRIASLWFKVLVFLSGAAHPRGTTPRDVRVTFLRHRAGLRRAFARIRAWGPERILLAHGLCYFRDGARELERALRWVG